MKDLEQVIEQTLDNLTKEVIRPVTSIGNVDQDAIPQLIDVGYYTDPKYWGKISDNDNDTIQFYINMATLEANNISYSPTGTIFERWDIKQDLAGYIEPTNKTRIRRAIALITDVFENADFDRTKGSYSLSLPGMSVSQSGEGTNLTVPQAAINELINAGFHLAPYSTEPSINNKPTDYVETDFFRAGNEEMENNITYQSGDGRYVRQFQESAQENWIPVVEPNKMVAFYPISEVLERGEVTKIENAEKIRDLNDGLFKHINEFPISTWDGLTDAEIFNLIRGYSGMWKQQFPYQKGSLAWANIDTTGKEIAIYESLQNDNWGNEPLSSPEFWQKKNFIIDVKDIVKEVIKQSQPLNAIEIKKQLDALPTIDNIIFNKNIAYNFTTKALFDLAKEEYKIQDTDYIVEENGTIFGHGENGEVVGDGLFKAYNLPRDMKLELGCYSLFNGSIHNSTVRFVDGYGGILSTRDTWPGQGWGGIASNNVNWSTTRFTIYLNGNVEQTQFKPQFTQKYMVTFNKDVIKRSVVKVDNNTTNFKEIEGNILDNRKSKTTLTQMINYTNSVSNDSFETSINLSSASDLSVAKVLTATTPNGNDAINLCYHLRDGIATFTGNWKNNKKIYASSGLIPLEPNSETTLINNIASVVNLTGLINESADQEFRGSFLPKIINNKGVEFKFENRQIKVKNTLTTQIVFNFNVEYTIFGEE